MKNIYTWLVIGVGIIIIIYNITSLQTTLPESYTEKIENIRKERSTYFQNSQDSPVKDKSDFKGLVYFPIDTTYKVQATLELLSKQKPMEVAMSQGKTEEFIRYAWAKFELKGQNYRLLLLKRSTQEDELFLPFTDKTSGNTTYGGGRYLDLPLEKGSKTIEIDFNLAYHPYCVYNYNYTCPVPPKENSLSLAIQAGEKLP